MLVAKINSRRVSLLYSRSVDGMVRRYDIRFGKLFTDTIGRKFKNDSSSNILCYVRLKSRLSS